MLVLRVIITSFVFFLLCSCAVVPGLNVHMMPDRVGAPEEIGGFRFVKVDAEYIRSLGQLASRVEQDGESVQLDAKIAHQPPNDYVVGVGDILNIIVWDHPELTNPTGDFRDPVSSGRLVDFRGMIFYPFVGEITVAGLTLSQIRNLLTTRLSRVIRDPQIDVRVADFRSKKVRVYGEVKNPGLVPLTDAPMTVVEAVAAAGGITDEASRRYMRLERGDNSTLIDLEVAAPSSVAYQRLQPGDAIYVPNIDKYSVYVLGSVNEQATLNLPYARISLAKALSESSGLDQTRARGDGVYVIRAGSVSLGHDDGVPQYDYPIVFHFDMSRLDGVIGAQHFDLVPNDIVYVDSTGIATYNAVVNQILPTVSTIFQLDQLLNR